MIPRITISKPKSLPFKIKSRRSYQPISGYSHPFKFFLASSTISDCYDSLAPSLGSRGGGLGSGWRQSSSSSASENMSLENLFDDDKWDWDCYTDTYRFFPAGSKRMRDLPTGSWVNGEYQEVPVNANGEDDSKNLRIENPATGEIITSLPTFPLTQISSLITQSQSLHSSGIWSVHTSSIQRSQILSKFGYLFQDEMILDELAKLESLQTGRPIREMRTQLGRLGEWMHYYAALLRTREDSLYPTSGSLLNYSRRLPLGVVLLLTPFNHPLLIAVKKLAPALATGNIVLLKPSELAPLSVLKLGELAKQAGVPNGVLSILTGDGELGKGLIEKGCVEKGIIKKVDLTGGNRVGKEVGGLVGKGVASFNAELGGKAPVVVFDDCDITMTVNGVAFGSFIASGQTCVSTSRIIVHRNIWEEFLKRLKEKLVGVVEERMGNPMNEKCSMGSVISENALKRVERMVKKAVNEEGAKILTGSLERMRGKSILDEGDIEEFEFEKGYFWKPTVLIFDDVGKCKVSEVWKEEIFGPVIVVVPFGSTSSYPNIDNNSELIASDEKEAISLANDSSYGLGASVWTKNGARGIRVADGIEAGLVWINGHHKNDPSSPWGGMKSSGIGRENGLEAFYSYSQTKSIIMNTASEKISRVNDDWFSEYDDEAGVAEGKRYG